MAMRFVRCPGVQGVSVTVSLCGVPGAWRPLSVAAVGNGTNGTGYRPVTAHYPPESALLTDPRALLNYVKSSKVSLWSMTSRFREKITVYVIVANL